MPVYRVKCHACEYVGEIFRKMSEYDDLPLHCDMPVTRVICAPMVSVDIPAYRATATGEMIEGRVQHREYLRKNNLVELGNEKLGHKKYEADHNVRPEMMDAIKQHLGR